MTSFVSDILSGSLAQIVGGLALLLLVQLLGWPAAALAKIRNSYSRLVARKHDSSGYFDDATINNSLRFYVRPMFQNVDPSREAEPAQALMYARDDLFDLMDRFLAQSHFEERHLFIFADSGMGKTSFLINFFARSYRFFALKKPRIMLVSLAHTTVEDQIREVPLSARKGINIFLDALDEDPRAIGRVVDRIKEVFAITEGFRRVVVTCRTQFFESDEQIPESTGIARSGPTRLNQAKHYPIRRVYLSPFDEKQVDVYLKKRYPGVFKIFERRRARALVRRVPSLSVRPMLLAHMPDLLATQVELNKTIDVYEAMVVAWANRERDWVEPGSLINFSNHLAADLYHKRAARGGEYAKPEEIARIAAANNVHLDTGRLTGRSLLNRTADGNFKFAHRSIMEYMVAESLPRLVPDKSLEITDQMTKFLLEIVGCDSDGAYGCLSGFRVFAKVSPVVRRIGYRTNSGIYNVVAQGANVHAIILRTTVRDVAGGRPRKLINLINDMSRSALNTDASNIRSVRIALDLRQGSSQCPIYVSSWVNSYAVLFAGNAEIPTGLLPVDSLICAGELVFFGDNQNKHSDLARFTWSCLSRVNVIGTWNTSNDDYGNPLSLYNNPAVAFEFDCEHNFVFITMVERSALSGGTYAMHGIFGDVKLVSESPYVTIGPVMNQ